MRRSRFVPLDREHARFNIEVALGEIGAFRAVETPLDPDSLLYVDLQENGDVNPSHSLGSGRSGFYRGKYLKGIGRTILAANWWNPSQVHYHTGHLLTSAAIREFVVTAYLRAKDLSHVINGVEGFLVRRQTRELRARYARLLARQPARLSARGHPWSGDLALQAITVKGGDFARLSNFIWLANRLTFGWDGPMRFDEFMLLLLDRLDPGRAPRALPAPSHVVDRLDAAVQRLLAYYREAWRVGVSWESVHNNFAIDGRFLDLETPTIVGGPLAGVIALDGPVSSCLVPSRTSLTGMFEVVGCIKHVRAGYDHLRARLRACWSSMSGLEREYVREVEQEMGLRFDRAHVLRSHDAVAATLVRWVREALDLGERQHRAIARAASSVCRRYLGSRPGVGELRLRPAGVRLARTGFHARVPHTLEGIELPRAALEEGEWVGAIVDRLDRISDVEQLLEALAAAAAQIGEYCRR